MSASDERPVLELTGVEHAYRRTVALRGVDLEVGPHEIWS